MFRCWKFKILLSAYVDNFLSASEWKDVQNHLLDCSACAARARQLRALSSRLRNAPVPEVPADLGLRIRVRLAQEQFLDQRPHWSWRLANWLMPYAFPVATGVLTAGLVFMILLPGLVSTVQASSDDVQLPLRTPARLITSWPAQIASADPDLVVKLVIDARGRVGDYDIIRGSDSPNDIRLLENILLFAFFEPATLLGRPTTEVIVLPLKDLEL